MNQPASRDQQKDSIANQVGREEPEDDFPLILVSDEIDPGEPPKLPPAKPPSARGRNAYVKLVARWLWRTGRLAIRLSPIGRALDIYEAGLWIYDHWPYIEAYQDQPKTLEELQDAVDNPGKGYEIHHIVEKTFARRAGYSDDLIEGRANKVRIPTLKHWELTGWMMTPNKDYGGLSPREYLMDKSWEERTEVGLRALREVGVLNQ